MTDKDKIVALEKELAAEKARAEHHWVCQHGIPKCRTCEKCQDIRFDDEFTWQSRAEKAEAALAEARKA